MSYNIEELNSEALTVVNSNALPSITSTQDFTRAGDILKILKNQSAAIEEKRKTYTDPLLKQQKLIKADFDKVKKPIDDAIDQIEASMKVFYIEDKARRDEEQTRLDADASSTAGPDGLLVSIVNNIKTQRGDIASTTMKEITRYEVLDIKFVPIEFLTVDDKKMKEHIAEGGVAPAGIKYFTELSVASR